MKFVVKEKKLFGIHFSNWMDPILKIHTLTTLTDRCKGKRGNVKFCKEPKVYKSHTEENIADRQLMQYT